jgi:hypothetical protein
MRHFSPCCESLESRSLLAGDLLGGVLHGVNFHLQGDVNATVGAISAGGASIGASVAGANLSANLNADADVNAGLPLPVAPLVGTISEMVPNLPHLEDLHVGEVVSGLASHLGAALARHLPTWMPGATYRQTVMPLMLAPLAPQPVMRT